MSWHEAANLPASPHGATRQRLFGSSALRVLAAAAVALAAPAFLGCAPGDSSESASADPVEGPSAESVEAVAPTCVTIRRGAFGAVSDAMIQSALPTTNFGATTTLGAGFAPAVQSLLRFDLSPVPAGSTVTSATMTLSTVTSFGGPLSLHRLLVPFSEPAVTWNLFGGAYSGLVEASSPSMPAPVSFNVTSLVQSWVSGVNPNNGVLLEQLPPAGDRFSSSEAAAIPTRPALTVCYTNLCAGVVCVPSGPCHVAGVCNPATGLCSSPASPNGAACSDGDPCTSPDTCQTGACVSGPKPGSCIMDLGDAPDSKNASGTLMNANPWGATAWAQFPSTYQARASMGLPRGPLHKNATLRYFLGTNISAEADADVGFDSDAQNNLVPPLGHADLDFNKVTTLGDDALILSGVAPPLAGCYMMSLPYRITLTAGTPTTTVYVNMWIDWNSDGMWNNPPNACGASERVMTNVPVVLTGGNPANVLYTLTTPMFTASANPGFQWIRLTLSDVAAPAGAGDGSGPSAGYTYGETEDYTIWGDASVVDPPGGSGPQDDGAFWCGGGH